MTNSSTQRSQEALGWSRKAASLSASDSTDPSSVGVWGALKGTFLTILVTMALAFPVGVLAAVYLGILLLGWVALLVAILGLAEPLFGIRERANRNAPPPDNDDSTI